MDNNILVEEQNNLNQVISALDSTLKAINMGARRVAFTSLGTGHNSIPLNMVIDDVVSAVVKFLNAHPETFDEIVWVDWNQDVTKQYSEAIAKYFKRRDRP